MEYHARRDVLERERTYRLSADGLAIEEREASPRVLPYAEIHKIRLRFFPTRFQTNRFECLVYCRGQRLRITNEFYLGFARFEDRSSAYRSFVVELCQRVGAVRREAEFVTGREAWLLNLEIGLCGLMALLLGWVLWLTGGPSRTLVWVKLGIIAFFLPVLVLYVKRNRPVRFEPGAVPEQVLPPAPKG
jgi:hypothetical protein